MSDAVILSLITAAGSLLTTLLSGLIAIRLGNLHRQLNSRMDQLLRSEKAVSRDEGVKEGQSQRQSKPVSPDAPSQ